MKITLGKAKGVLVRIVSGDVATKKFVREKGKEYLEVTLSKEYEMTDRKFRLFVRSLIRFSLGTGIKVLSLDVSSNLLSGIKQSMGEDTFLATLAENAMLANYNYTAYKTKPKQGHSYVDELVVTGVQSTPVTKRALLRGQIIGTCVNECRDLANTPGGDMTPTKLASHAKATLKGQKVRVSVLGKKEMIKLKMGALLGVAKGSVEAPTFTILEYKGAKRKPIVLVGKGVTFDSGGLNIKSSAGIYEMHMDMSGAAAVLYTVKIAAMLKLKINLIGLMPSVENMLQADAYRPGDVLTAMNGKTIEVLNTDAEGRLILADALTYAKRFKPRSVIDVATLTGASMVALGLHANAIMSRDDELRSELLEHGERSGDYSWPLPLWDEYEGAIFDGYADLTNIATGKDAGYGGATNGGIFLWQFAKELECPWAHIDMAPRMTSHPKDELARGAAGAPIRLLVSYLSSSTHRP